MAWPRADQAGCLTSTGWIGWGSPAILRCAGEDMVSDWLNEAAGSGLPFRLTLQQAARVSAPAADDIHIHVCENPAVLRVAAGELGTSSAALVCTEGVPSAACHAVLGKAAARGARLHWRADFDWTGLHIVSAAVTRHAARPWRMTADDYRDALAAGKSTPLTGPATRSPWDPRLASLMPNMVARSLSRASSVATSNIGALLRPAARSVTAARLRVAYDHPASHAWLDLEGPSSEDRFHRRQAPNRGSHTGP